MTMEGGEMMMATEVFLDGYGQVRQSPGLAEAIADDLTYRPGPLIFSWCDNHDTRLTVTVSIPQRIGSVPGFAPDADILFVAVEGYGCYGFAVKDEPLHPAYIAEKLSHRDKVNPTWVAMAELVGGIRMALARQEAVRS